MVPSVGCSKPAMSRSTVVLPDPDGPSIEKNSPAAISRSTWSTAVTAPNSFVRPVSRMAGCWSVMTSPSMYVLQIIWIQMS